MIFADAPTWTGSLPTWLIFIAGLIAVWRISRGGGGSAVTELTAANKFLEQENERNKAISAEQAKQIAVLESKTDVVLAVTPLLAEHERLARERHEATIHVLEAMSTALNGAEKGAS